MIKKFYELDEGEKVNHGDGILTFKKIDGTYSQWANDKGQLVIGHAYEYEFQPELGYYTPINPT